MYSADEVDQALAASCNTAGGTGAATAGVVVGDQLVLLRAGGNLVRVRRDETPNCAPIVNRCVRAIAPSRGGALLLAEDAFSYESQVLLYDGKTVRADGTFPHALDAPPLGVVETPRGLAVLTRAGLYLRELGGAWRLVRSFDLQPRTRATLAATDRAVFVGARPAPGETETAALSKVCLTTPCVEMPDEFGAIGQLVVDPAHAGCVLATFQVGSSWNAKATFHGVRYCEASQRWLLRNGRLNETAESLGTTALGLVGISADGAVVATEAGTFQVASGSPTKLAGAHETLCGHEIDWLGDIARVDGLLLRIKDSGGLQ